MTGTIAHVVLPAAIFLGFHFLVSGTPLRALLVRTVGAAAYRILFSIISLASFVWLILAYGDAPVDLIWYLPELAWVGIVVMPFALLGLVAAYSTKPVITPASGDGDSAGTAVGIFRITRHPFLWSVALWAASHLLVNGDVASLIFFGTLLALGAIGPFRVDAKKRAMDPAEADRLAAATSNVPFAAIVQGRASLSLSEIGWVRIAAAAALYVVLLLTHGLIFGAPILT